MTQEGSSWEPVDLGPILDGTFEQERPAFLPRTDGVCLFYSGRLHLVSAEPESCKGWMALHAAVERVHAGDRVLYIDYEDSVRAIVSRLRDLGATDDEIQNRFTYVHPEDPSEDIDLRLLLCTEPELVIIDAFTGSASREGLSILDNEDVETYYQRIARPFVRAGAATVILDHLTKDRESRGGFGIGAQHKKAGADVSYELSVVKPFGRGREALVKVKVTKDKPGGVREHEDQHKLIAMMRLTSSVVDGAVTVALEPPPLTASADGWRPTVLMERVSRAVEQNPGAYGVRDLREVVTGKNAHIDKARKLLIADDCLTVDADGKHHVAKPFRNPDAQGEIERLLRDHADLAEAA